MVSCRIRVMGTLLDTNELKWMIRVAQPPESKLDRILREIRQEQESDRTLDQDFVAPAPCHIPLWAAGLATPLVAPASYHMPIEVVSARVREHQHEERTPSGVVSWTVEARERFTDQQTQYAKESEQMITVEGQVMPSCKGRMILVLKSRILQGDCHFVEEFFNLRNSSREREWRGSWPKMTEMRQKQDIERRLNRDSRASAICLSRESDWSSMTEVLRCTWEWVITQTNSQSKNTSLLGIELEQVAAVWLSNPRFFCHLTRGWRENRIV